MKRVLFLVILQFSMLAVYAQNDTSLARTISWLNKIPEELDKRVMFYDFTDQVKFEFSVEGESDSLEMYWMSSYYDKQYSKWMSERKRFRVNDVFAITVRPYVKELFEVSIDFRDPKHKDGYSSVYFIFDEQAQAQLTFGYLKALIRKVEIQSQFSNQL